MAKISGESYENQKAQFLKLSFLLGKTQYFVIATFKMLKVQFKYKCLCQSVLSAS